MPSLEVIVAILILGLVRPAIAFVVFSALIGEIGPVRATVITLIDPAVLGVLTLQEPFTAGMAIGFGLVLAGSILATRTRAPSEVQPSDEVVPVAAA